jgi:hypothetical protein
MASTGENNSMLVAVGGDNGIAQPEQITGAAQIGQAARKVFKAAACFIGCTKVFAITVDRLARGTVLIDENESGLTVMILLQTCSNQ